MMNTREIRYYVGDAPDFEGCDYFDVEASTYTFEWEAEEAATELYDECYPPVEVGGLTFDASRIVSELDPVAWRGILADMISEIDISAYDNTGNED